MEYKRGGTKSRAVKRKSRHEQRPEEKPHSRCLIKVAGLPPPPPRPLQHHAVFGPHLGSREARRHRPLQGQDVGKTHEGQAHPEAAHSNRPQSGSDVRRTGKHGRPGPGRARFTLCLLRRLVVANVEILPPCNIGVIVNTKELDKRPGAS
jgi:hypothetical protein